MRCCRMDCTEDAEFEIQDLADQRETAFIHTCTEHVGPTLGHDAALADGAEDRWLVTALPGPESKDDDKAATSQSGGA